jgi:GH15 family glucan-1,4-alpha-glucosidase
MGVVADRIEDYAVIGNCLTAALIGNRGSIDWLCLPRFDSGACFAALLGTADHGRWLLTPVDEPTRIGRSYCASSLILETRFETAGGAVSVLDFMPPHHEEDDLVRIVVGRRGSVRMRMELTLRFDYGSFVPWVRQSDGGIQAVAGPNAVRIRTPVALRGEEMRTVAEFAVSEGDRVPFVMTWHASHQSPPAVLEAEELLATTRKWWDAWSQKCTYRGIQREAVLRSLITLKALTYAPTGGIVAAPTTSLPERIGGVRNWDYRLCWLRDATFTLHALMSGGYIEEACAWRDWLVRAVAGMPAQVQPLYGLGGERRLPEIELPWLPGYEDSRPVRLGNAAHQQLQIDIFGEVMDALYFARQHGLAPDPEAWRVERALLTHLESIWHLPDAGIWEMRGPPQHFTHSKVMAWVAFDRGVKAVEQFGLEGPVDRWRLQRDRLHAEICDKGFDRRQNSFVQAYGSEEVDAALLMLPLVGFLPSEDPRVRGTVAAIERRLTDAHGFVRRYATHTGADGLPAGEGSFLLCTFWLVDNYVLLGRVDEAQRLFDKLIAIANDVGLLPEEYDPLKRRFLGNFPQAFSHVALINSARSLSGGSSRSVQRPGQPGTALRQHSRVCV